MSITKLVVSVHIEKFDLELAVNKNSDILSLVGSMRDSHFISESVKTNRLIFRTARGRELKLKDCVMKIVED